MSYLKNLQSQIISTQTTIDKCEQELSKKSLEKHIKSAWETVLCETRENLNRLQHTAGMNCFDNQAA